LIFQDYLGTAKFYSVSGNLYASAFIVTSDRRAKTDIVDITPQQGVDFVKAGRPRHYVLDGRPAAGFIAQEEIEAGRSEPILYSQNDQPEYAESDGVCPAGQRMGRDYAYDVAYLTAALQSALSRIDALEARLG
jgi:hypothetical protein